MNTDLNGSSRMFALLLPSLVIQFNRGTTSMLSCFLNIMYFPTGFVLFCANRVVTMLFSESQSVRS